MANIASYNNTTTKEIEKPIIFKTQNQLLEKINIANP